MGTIAQSGDALRTLAASFEPGREGGPPVNDMFEAADDWRSFGEPLLRNGGRGRFPGRVQEEELHAKLQGFYSLAIKNNDAPQHHDGPGRPCGQPAPWPPIPPKLCTQNLAK